MTLDDVDSTMDELHRRAEGGGEDGLAVVAARQVSGRGRLGRRWAAGPGGLWCSVLARDVGGLELEVLSLRVGIAVALAVESAIPRVPRILLKWPNDLRLGERKVGGVLIEARWQGTHCEWAVVGIGLNLQNRIPTELADTAASLAEVTDVPTPGDLAPLVVEAIRTAIGRKGTLTGPELEAWSLRDALHGRRLMTPTTGIAEGITPDGSLRVRRSDGRLVAIRTGEVAADGATT